MPSGRVGNGSIADRELPPITLEQWSGDAEPVKPFHAAIIREVNGQRRLFGLMVKHLSKDRERAFVKFETDGHTITGWVPVDDLRPG